MILCRAAQLCKFTSLSDVTTRSNKRTITKMSFVYFVGIICYLRIYVVSSHENGIYFSDHNCSIASMRHISTVAPDAIVISNCSLTTLSNGVFLSHATSSSSSITLNISNTDLETIEENALNGLKRLEILSLHRNRLTKIRSWSEHDFVNLHKLDLHHNNIQTISLKAFQHYPNLETINLSINNLTNIPVNIFAYTPQLRNINLAKNHLTRIDGFTFNELFELTHVSLEHNDIDFVDSFAFSNNERLQSIRLDFNKIVMFDTLVLFNCQHLAYVNLSYNALSTIHAHTFKRNFQLNVLDISGNRIAKFEKNSFSGLSNLEVC